MRRRLADPTQVRLSPPTKDRLIRVASRFAIPTSELIRQAVEWKLDSWEKSKELTIRQVQEAA